MQLARKGDPVKYDVAHHDSGKDAMSRPDPEPGGSLQDLASSQEGVVRDLLEGVRRSLAVLPVLPEAQRAAEESRFQLVARALVQTLAGWQALGGRVRLEPPVPGLGFEAPVVPPALVSALNTGIPARPEAPPPPAAPPSAGALLDTPVRLPPKEPPPVQVRDEEPEPSWAPGSVDWSADLADLLEEIHTSPNAQEEMEKIQRTANMAFSRWSIYPRTVQRALVGNLACRLRHLQDHLGVSGPKLDGAFRGLTRYSKSFQPGWVNGLTRGRGPAADSWAEEARNWWQQLVYSSGRPLGGKATGALGDSSHPMDESLLKDVRSWLEEWRGAPKVAKPMCLEKTIEAIRHARQAGVPVTDPELCRLAGEIYDHLEVPAFLRLRQAIRDTEAADREESGGQEPETIPTDWPWWSHTVGRQAVLVGEGPSPLQLGRVEASFGFSQVRCVTTAECEGDPAALRAGVAGADLVVVLARSVGLGGCQAVVRACQETGAQWVVVEHGYGVTRIRMAVERYLQPDPVAPAR